MSPLELFRRNQKVMMTGLILLAMFAFVALPTVEQYMRTAGPGIVDPVVAEFNGIALKDSRVAQFTRQHNMTVRFLTRLAEETIKRGGSPQVPGFSFDSRTGQVQSIGINNQPSMDMSIRTLQFAAEAQDKGFDLDDFAISEWLKQYTNDTFSEREMFALLRRESNNQMGQYQLFDMLRKQLLSTLYFRSAQASVGMGNFALRSPLDHWNAFLKLNQQATINAYGVLVNDYIDQTDSNPAESEVVAVYDAGKTRFPSEQSPEPGFRRRDEAKFEYVRADLQAFRDELVDDLTEAEIRAEYEKRIAGGAFQLPPETEEPSAETGEDAAETGEDAAETGEDAAETGEDAAETGEDSKPEMTEKPEMAEAGSGEKAAEDDAPDAVVSEVTEEEKTGETTDETAEANKQQVEAFAKELEQAGKLPETSDEQTEGEQAESAEEPNTDDQSAMPRAESAVRLTLLQSDVSTEQTQETTEQQTTEQQTTGESDTAEEPAETEEAAPRYRPFEEVKDQIAQSMVEEEARVALDQAVTEVRTAMRRYSRAQAIYETAGDDAAKPPVRPNLEKMADELGLVYREIGPFDATELEDEPISESVDEGTAFSQRGVPFTAMMFGVGDQIIKKPVFTPAVSVNLATQQTFVAWKIEETDSYIPELDEVRDEVVRAIRVQQARELARKAAEELAEKANQSSEGSLKDLVPEDRADQLKTDLGPFSWLNMAGFGQFTIGNVPELDSVGPAFMESVFGADGDEVVVAPNSPRSVFYVVNRTNLQPATQDLRSIFAQPSERTMSMFMPDDRLERIQSGFFDAVDEKTGFVQIDVEP